MELAGVFEQKVSEGMKVVQDPSGLISWSKLYQTDQACFSGTAKM